MEKLSVKERVALAEMAKDIGYIMQEIKEIKDNLDNKYVQRSEFEPVKKLVYGLVCIILTVVVGGIMGLVIIK